MNEALEEWSNEEIADGISYAEQFVEAANPINNVDRQTFELIQLFGEISLDATRSAIEKAASPSSAELVKISGETSKLAIWLGGRLGTKTFGRLEQEREEELILQARRRTHSHKQHSLRHFWRGVEMPEPQRSPGLIKDWKKKILTEFHHRALTTSDIVKVLFASELDVHSSEMNSRTNVVLASLRDNKFRSEYESETGLKLVSGKAEKERSVLFAAVGQDEANFDIQKAKRLTDEELRGLAIKLRQQALEDQNQTAEERKKQQIEKSWEGYELDKWEWEWSAKAQADKWLTPLENEHESYRKGEAGEDGRREIEEWKEQEDVWLREEEALTEEVRLRKSAKEKSPQASGSPEIKFVSYENLGELFAANPGKYLTYMELVEHFRSDTSNPKTVYSKLSVMLSSPKKKQKVQDLLKESRMALHTNRYSLNGEGHPKFVFVALHETEKPEWPGLTISNPPEPSVNGNQPTEELTGPYDSLTSARKEYSWELSFRARVDEAVGILTANGFDAGSKIAIGNQEAIDRLWQQKLITDEEHEAGELSFDSAVLAMIIRSSDGRRPIKGSNGEFKNLALSIMRRRIAERLANSDPRSLM